MGYFGTQFKLVFGERFLSFYVVQASCLLFLSLKFIGPVLLL